MMSNHKEVALRMPWSSLMGPLENGEESFRAFRVTYAFDYCKDRHILHCSLLGGLDSVTVFLGFVSSFIKCK